MNVEEIDDPADIADCPNPLALHGLFNDENISQEAESREEPAYIL